MTFSVIAQSGEEVNFNSGKEKETYTTMQFNLLFGNSHFSGNMLHIIPYFTEITSFGYDIPYDQRALAVSPSVSLSHGRVYNEHWSTGLGVGFEIFDHNLFPLFAEIRYTFSDYKIAPIVVLKGGYSFGGFKAKHYDELYLNWTPYHIYDTKLRHYGGLMFHPEIGVKVPLTVNSDLLITTAYDFQKTKSIARKDYDNDDFEEWEHNIKFNRLSFGIGIMFK